MPARAKTPPNPLEFSAVPGHLTYDPQAAAPVGGVNEVLSSQALDASITAWSLTNDARMETWAKMANLDVESFRLIAAKNPDFLQKIIESETLVGAPNTTTTAGDFVAGKYTPQRTMVDLTGDEGNDLARMVSGRGPADLKQLAETLVPEDKRGTHIWMWDAPGRDGKVYSRSLIRKDRKSIEVALAKGFSVVPRGPIGDPPAHECDMVDVQGFPCGKMMRSPADLQTHKETKHNRQYRAMVEKDARDLQVQQLSIARQNLELQRRQLGLDVSDTADGS